MDLARSEHLPAVLLAVAVGIACGIVARRRRTRAWKAIGAPGALPGSGASRWLLAIVAAGVALVGPRWGFAPGGESRPGHQVVLLIDVSRSMAAEDAVPNRLGASVAGASAILEAMGRSPGDRVAVVAFAGRGVLRCPMTANLGAAQEALSRLRPGAVRPGGSDLEAALIAAREAFPDDQGEPVGRSVVVFSDGEDLEGHGRRAIEGLRASGIVVHAVTVGDASSPGATVPMRDAAGSPSELTYHGQVVHTRREDTTLRAIAAETGGTFIPLGLSRPEDISKIYQMSIQPSEQARGERLARGSPVDRSGLFAILALAAGISTALPIQGRRRSLALAALAMLTLGADRPAPSPGDPGMSAFRAGDLDAALASYERDIAASPRAAVPRFNAAVVLQRQGRHDEADARYAQALSRAEAEGSPALSARIEFARGNNAYLQGDRAEALAHYDACLKRNGDDPALAAIQRDAKINRDFIQAQAASPSPKKPEEPPPTGSTPAPSEDHKGGEEEKASTKTAPSPGGAQGGEPSKAATEAPEQPQTPEERLEQAVSRIRQRFRAGAEPPPTVVDPNRRDW